MKIDVEKLRAALLEAGMDESQVEEILAVASDEEPKVDDVKGEGEEPSTVDEAPVEEEAPVGDPVPEGEGEVVPPQEEVPADPVSVPLATEEPIPEVPPQEEPPVEVPPEVPPMPELPPMVSVEEFNQLKSDFEELKAAKQGLEEQVNALKEALQNAGVLDGASVSTLGEETPHAPAGNPVDTTLDDVLNSINRKGY